MGGRGAIFGILISKYAIINTADEGWGDKSIIIGGKSEG
jgi:hypothetical protein